MNDSSGYSVTEAASVLGVPTERVWELLARGVLSGVPDGESGMRVFLQPRPAPSALDQSPRSNDNARETDAEASPFRALLTEFRSLTERYGQALLALGEARGEVASLRSRVDLLEARMDLRLQMSSPMSADANPMERSHPQPEPEPEPEPSPADASAPMPEAEPPGAASQADPEPKTGPELEPETDQPETDPQPEAGPQLRAEDEPETEGANPRKRVRSHFREDFADALARADDPTPAVLPAAAEMTAAINSMRDEPPMPVDAAADRPASAEAAAELPAAVGPEPTLEVGTAPQPSWDQERYTAQIDAPDWWTQDAPDEPTTSEPTAALDQPVPAAADAIPPPESTRRPSTGAAAAMKPREPFAGEETMLWFGRRPGGSESAEWPAEDAAGEMEVASTGRRRDADPPAGADMPGSQELDDALAALDAVGPPRRQVAATPPPEPPTPQRTEVRSPASRAYRRLRRIFPG
ncbi:MAG: hypothetical protein M3Q38_01900 [Chloroflexota bacterium]|nr:hypothetical protein [Chloroflexota bacterium]